MKDMEYVNLFTNMMSEGFIFIDNEGIIRLYNESAKEIFGLSTKYKISHEAGRLKEGDLIIIANTSLGSDDGDMDQDSLELLGFPRDYIARGQAFILISRYKGKNLTYRLDDEYSRRLVLKCRMDDLKIDSIIDFNENLIDIVVDGVSYPLEFINNIGHLVVLDGQSHELKFYQSNGYTARKESINDLLKGRPYSAKSLDREEIDLVGESIFSIHKSESLIEDFYKVAKGADLVRKEKYEEINGFPTLCSIIAVESLGRRLGAALKVEDISKVEQLILDRDKILKDLERATKEMREKKDLELMFQDYIGQTEGIIQSKKLAYRAAKTLSNLLILGSPGVGKTSLAKLIHKNSLAGDGQFLSLNCRYLNQDNFSQSLKDFQKGSIYLEEIGDLSLELQSRLLEILNEPKEGIRFIFSSSKNLDKMILSGSFNEKLYYKINVFPIYIEDLKDRRSDIRLLVDYLLPRICRLANVEEKRMSKEAFEILNNYAWPGNVRELINILERAVNLTLGNNILTKHIVLLEDMQRVDDKVKSLKEALEEREKLLIQTAIARHKGDRKKVIGELGISQSTFYEKLNKYDLN